MVGMYTHTTFNLNPRASSIDTPLHSFIPFKHVDHMHPNAAISVAASRNSVELTKEIYGDEVIHTPWLRPGFELGLAMQKIVRENPQAKGIMMGQHGLINWANDDKECYELTLALIEKAAEFIEQKYEAKGGHAKAFGGAEIPVSLEEGPRRAALAKILPWLRGQVSQKARFIGTIQDDETILPLRQFARRPAPRGTRHELPGSFPAHQDQAALRGVGSGQRRPRQRCSALLTEALAKYREDYAAYYNRCKHANSPAMRDPNPTVILIPGLGHDRVGQGQDRVARDRGVLQLRRGSDARRGGDRRIHRAAAAGGLRHRVLAAGGGEAEAHAGGEGTRAAGAHRRRRRQRHRQGDRAPAGEGRRAHRLRGYERRPRPRPPRRRSPTSSGSGIGVAGSGISGCGPAIGLAANITDRASIRAMLDQVALAYGGFDAIEVTAGVFVAERHHRPHPR